MSEKVLGLTPHILLILPGSWKGTKAKLYRGLFGLLRDVSRILDAPSMTWTRSSYMEPVTSKTNARVDAPSGMSSFVAPGPESCPAENATDSARDSNTNVLPISEPRCFSGKVLEFFVCVFLVCFVFFCSRQSEPQGEPRDEGRDIGLPKKKPVRFEELKEGTRIKKESLVPVRVFGLWCGSSRSLSPLCELNLCGPSSCSSACCLQSQEPLFSSVIQRPPLSWPDSLRGAHCPMHKSRALIGRQVLGDRVRNLHSAKSCCSPVLFSCFTI